MHACTSFFCLSCIATSCSFPRKQSFWAAITRTRRAPKIVNAIASLLFLLAITFLPVTQAWAQAYPVVDTFSGSGALSSNWTNSTGTDQTHVPAARFNGTVVPSVAGQTSLVTYTGSAFTRDQYAQVQFVAH